MVYLKVVVIGYDVKMAREINTLYDLTTKHVQKQDDGLHLRRTPAVANAHAGMTKLTVFSVAVMILDNAIP
jgi:hypothetical protein